MRAAIDVLILFGLILGSIGVYLVFSLGFALIFGGVSCMLIGLLLAYQYNAASVHP